MKLYLKETGWNGCTGLIWLKIGQVADCCDHGDLPVVFIKFDDFPK